MTFEWGGSGKRPQGSTLIRQCFRILKAEMSTTRASYIYGSNVPEFIQRQIQQLHENEARIVELEAELSQLRKNHAQLEHDLEPYRVDSSFADVTLAQKISIEPTDIETAPINRCPDEILCLIFDNFVLVLCHHLYIRRLLLVCRRWYTLVTNTAKLWAQIEISSPWDLFDIGSQKSRFPYIFACLNHSKNLPITVYLDMQYLSHQLYIAEALAQQAKAIIDEDDHDMIFQRIRNQDWNFRSTGFDSQLERVIERVMGVDGEHIRCWGTMTLCLPDDADMAIRLWNRLARGLMAVEKLTSAIFHLHLLISSGQISEVSSTSAWTMRKTQKDTQSQGSGYRHRHSNI
jgi:hypothetical protein